MGIPPYTRHMNFPKWAAFGSPVLSNLTVAYHPSFHRLN
jgi:hypothetical protein